MFQNNAIVRRSRPGLLAVCGAMVLALGMAPAARADTNIDLSWFGSYHSNVKIFGPLAPDGVIFGWRTVAAGPFSAVIVTPSTTSAPFVTFCVDILHGISVPTAGTGYNVNIEAVSNLNGGSSLTDTNSGLAAAWLYNEFVGGINSAAKGAGLQLAIWETIYEGAGSAALGDFASGAFRATNNTSAISQAIVYVNALKAFLATDTLTNDPTIAWFNATPDTVGQDMIGQPPAGVTITPVPEPATLAMSGLGLLVVGLLRIRHRRGQAAS